MSNSGNSKSWIDELRRAERLPANYTAMVFDHVVPLAERVWALHAFRGRSIVIGINGAQGSGKSTLALFLANWLEHELGLTVAILSLDDLYLCKNARKVLAKQRHPLLRTRGVPGTHDIELGVQILAALTDSCSARAVTLPGFDKATDDRAAASQLRQVDAPVDVVLFEGWCVGARPQPDSELIEPVNELEAAQDADRVWRSYVNDRLKNDYAELFEQFDALVMLRVPSFDKVLEWRELQEKMLRENADDNGAGETVGMNAVEIRRFVMHFERLTRHMLKDVPGYANTVIDIDDSHNMADMTHRNWPCEGASRDLRT